MVFSRTFAERALAVLILGAVLVVAFMTLIRPMSARYVDNGNEIAESRERLGRYQADLRHATSLEATASKSAGEASKGSVFLSGETDALILAHLQSQLKNLASANGARFQGARSLPVRVDSDVRHVGVRLSVSGTALNLRNLLHAIENSLPYLIVDNAHLRRQQRTINATATASVAIMAQLDVFGAVNATSAE